MIFFQSPPVFGVRDAGSLYDNGGSFPEEWSIESITAATNTKEARMKKMKWDESFNLGIPLIDSQHRRIVDMINTLLETPVLEYSSETFSDLLCQAITYATEHFTAEEAFMEEIEYPGLAAHRLEHKEFLVRIAEESKNAMEKRTEETDLLPFFMMWLGDHILTSDRHIVRYHAARLKAVADCASASQME
jgi:hemerythrin